MIRLAVVGLGKMGLSHLAMINAHPGVTVAAICDSSAYVLDVLNKYTGLATFTDYEQMLEKVALDAVIIATPSRFHVGMVRRALEKGLHVFCEKPFCLDPSDADALTAMAAERGLVNQVGYHCRFVAAFQEVKRLLDLNAIGEVSHILAEAYGPVVLKPAGSTWRQQQTEGGGCLYDYAAHPLNLVNWYLGQPVDARGSTLQHIFSRQTDDAVYSSLTFPGGATCQLSVNWSDESYRKMTTRVTLWGSKGSIYADKQECRLYLREPSDDLPDYQKGWTVKYTTDLTPPVWFYIRGEEYSAQLDYFVQAIRDGRGDNINSFQSAAQTDQVIAMILRDSQGHADAPQLATVAPKKKKFSLFGR